MTSSTVLMIAIGAIVIAGQLLGIARAFADWLESRHGGASRPLQDSRCGATPRLP
jgi:phosphotransferase system  glucose/maltose/N-acetylglucosamine-specific IIC component